MPLLALDACWQAVSVALEWRDEAGAAQRVEAYEELATGHAERIVPMIAEVAQRAGVAVRAIDRIAVTVGPGSFTGVRTGIAAARALALATGAPVLGATSLAVIAERARLVLAETSAEPMPRVLCVAVDARRGEVYAQSFAQSGAAPLSDPILAPAGQIAASLPDAPSVVVGSGMGPIVAEARRLGKPARGALPQLQPRASILLTLASRLRVVDPPMPLYIRPPDAKLPTIGALPKG